MKKRTFKMMSVISAFVALIIMWGCEDKDLYDPTKAPGYVGDVPSTLDFSTTRSVELDFSYDAPNGFVSVYDLYTEYPMNEDGTLRTDLVPLSGGINVVGIPSVRVIPSHVKELYSYTRSLFVPVLSKATIDSRGTAKFYQVNLPEVDSNDGASTRTIGNKRINKELTKPSDFYQTATPGKHIYDLINPALVKEIPAEVLTAFSQTFPDGVKSDPKFYRDATFEIIDDNDGEGIEVFLSVIYANALFNNALSYFTYKGAKAFKDFTTTERNNLRVINIFRYADVYNNAYTNKGRGLTPGHYVKLQYVDQNGVYSDKFPKGAKIGFILHSNAFLGSINSELNLSKNWFYSTPEWNTSDKHGKNRTIFFSAKANDGETFNCFGFEDTFNGDGDCNDLLFHVFTEPTEVIVPPPPITPEDIEKTTTKKGIVAFEDNWPIYGDYDLNDVVVKYNSEITYIEKAKPGTETYEAPTVKKVVDHISIVHTGADFNNAFSYKVDINPASIKSIKIDNIPYSLIPDGNGFIIDLCPNVRKVINPMDYNTPSKDYTVEMEFVDGAVKETDFVGNQAPYNPFISPAEHPGVEVHLPMYKPTSRVDMKFFGTEQDRSDPDKDIWYVSGKENKYPFAIHLANANDDFVVPVETEKIYHTYPDYTPWVESGMKTNLDWYLKPRK